MPPAPASGMMPCDTAVAFALAHNAAFLEALADLGFSFADLEQARQLPNPLLTLLFPFPIGTKFGEGTLRQAFETLRFRKQRVQAAELENKRVAERLVQTGLDLIRDVRVTFADLIASRKRVQIARELAENQQKIAALLEVRFKTGDVSKLDAAVVESEAARLSEDIPRLLSAEEQVLARLKALVGTPAQDAGIRFVESPVPSEIPSEMATLARSALQARPDLRAAQLAIEAAAKRAGIAERDIIQWNGILDANFNPGDLELGPGVDVSLPILNRNEANRARAKAELERAVRQYRTARDRVLREVAEAHVRVIRAKDVLATQRDHTMRVAEKAEAAAGHAHTLGDVSLQVVLEARGRRLDATLRAIDMQAELSRALAELERAVGQRVAHFPASAEKGIRAVLPGEHREAE